MLVLTRHRDEQILIGDDIVIEVLDILPRKGIVRLGITAPPEVPVHRQEVYERIRRGQGVEIPADLPRAAEET